MDNALIGYTGFVGKNLCKQRPGGLLFNSKNFRNMQDQAFEDVICAGVSAVKWLANKNPAEDRANIQSLMDILETITAKRFILISTIDVYPIQQRADESFDCRSQENHHYGTHRLAFEDFCLRKFPRCHIIRLPGLFGEGLKKNVIFDLLNDNCLEMINSASSFQYYDLSLLWKDIQIALKEELRVTNLFTEPIPTQTILERFFPSMHVGNRPSPEVHYDLQTRYASLFGQTKPYVYRQEQVITQLERFITQYKKD